mmetsp:Transcript_45052/g.84058  ORF Transcript_45052/g.84058 Transcript_45052/m.84058 type:complete len:272 (+) Transcript_45052:238-1053(+)
MRSGQTDMPEVGVPGLRPSTSESLGSRMLKDRPWKGRGDTPLHHAAHAGHVKVVDLLSVERFADVINKASDSDGATPLMRCCETGALDCTQLLFQRGADINCENIRNERPLHIAFQHGHFEIAEFLLKSGAKKCAGRCMKCQLSLKQLQRRLKRDQEEKAREEKQEKSASAVESVEDILEQEFGGIDLAEEIARMKAEGGLYGGLGLSGGIELGAGIPESFATDHNSAHGFKDNGGSGSRKSTGRKAKGKGQGGDRDQPGGSNSSTQATGR